MARRFADSCSSSSSRSTGRRRSDTADSSCSFGLLSSLVLEMNYEAEVGEVKKCLCEVKAPRFTPWKTDKNPGRRYFGCPNWTWKGNEMVHHCKYFEWYDAKFTDRSVFLIRSLRNERDWYKREVDVVRNERDALRQERVDWIDDREALVAELRAALAKEATAIAGLKENNAKLAALKGSNVKLFWALVVVGFFMLVISFTILHHPSASTTSPTPYLGLG